MAVDAQLRREHAVYRCKRAETRSTWLLIANVGDNALSMGENGQK